MQMEVRVMMKSTPTAALARMDSSAKIAKLVGVVIINPSAMY